MIKSVNNKSCSPNDAMLNKELVKVLTYTTATKNREDYVETCIMGRTYYKTGVKQAVTIVCNVYKVFNKELNCFDYMGHCGMAKQHPNDTKINKKEGYSIAQTNAYINPFLVMKVNKRFGQKTFNSMMDSYVYDMDLEFIKTRDEIELINKNPKNYSR